MNDVLFHLWSRKSIPSSYPYSKPICNRYVVFELYEIFTARKELNYEQILCPTLRFSTLSLIFSFVYTLFVVSPSGTEFLGPEPPLGRSASAAGRDLTLPVGSQLSQPPSSVPSVSDVGSVAGADKRDLDGTFFLSSIRSKLLRIFFSSNTLL
jgi:hypothetical protein